MTGSCGSDDCREVFARLSEYLDRELNPKRQAHVESHLAGCEPCLAFLESLRRTVDLVRTSDRPRLTDAQREELLRRCRPLLDGSGG